LDDDSHARRRLFVIVGRLVAAPGLLLCLWISEWPTMATGLVLAAFAASIFFEVKGPARLRMVGDAMALFALFAAVAGSYGPPPNGPALTERLRRLGESRVLFGTLVFLTLACILFPMQAFLVRLLRGMTDRLARHAGSVAYGVTLILVVVLAADAYFIGRGQPFDYALGQDRPRVTLHPGIGRAHAAEATLHDVPGQRFSQQKPPGVTRIVLNGASTMRGWGLPDDQSPANELRRALARAHPEIRAEVLTLAWDGKFQRDEATETLLALVHWQPDLVLSMNGFNEAWYGESAGRPEGMLYWEPEAQALLEVSPAAALFWGASHFGASAWSDHVGGVIKAGPLERPILYEPPRYYGYLRATARTLADAGIPYAYAFCPDVLELNESEEIVGHDDAGLFEEVRKRRRAAAAIVTAEGELAFDPMAPLAKLGAQAAFIDLCHLTSEGIRRVMEDIAARIPGWLAHRPARDPRRTDNEGSLGPLRFASDASALYHGTAVGKVVGSTLRTLRAPGTLQHGPYFPLRAGQYAVTWYGRVARPGRVQVDAAVGGLRGTVQVLAARDVTLAPTDRIRALARVDFTLAADADDLEYRFMLEEPGVDVTLERIILAERW
jgi:hypothetical protein